jgi:hypothetical protein
MKVEYTTEPPLASSSVMNRSDAQSFALWPVVTEPGVVGKSEE